MAYNIKNGMFSNGIRLAGEEMYVHSGGRVEATVVDYSSLYVYHGGNARSTQVNSNGKFYVTGGQADRTDVNLQGNMFVAAGGKAENTNVKYKGALHVSVGGEARTVSAVNGSVYVSEGGLLSGGKFAENALLHVFSGGVVRNVKLQDQTLCDIYGSGSGIEASGGKIRIFGSAGELSAGRSTAVTVLSGGILTDAVLTSGASAELQSGARGHGILIGAAASLKTAGSAAYITVGSGAVCRVTGGTAQNIVARGDLSVGKAGSAAEVVVSAGGKVFAEGRISDISVETGGELRMTGEAERITVSGLAARVDVVSGKLVSGTVGAGASMLLGGTGTLICVEKNGTLEVTSGGLLFGTDIISAGKIRISSGGTVASSLLSASEAELEGAAQMMTVGAAACLHVRGSAADSVLSGGTLIVYQQGTASGAVVTQGGVLHVSGGQAGEIVLSDRAQLTVFDGTAENISAVRGATVQVRKDGTLSKAHLGDNGTLLAGGSVSSLEVGPGGRMSVLAQGTVREAVISSAGTLDVSSGGRAEDIEVSRGGKMTVLTSGAVEDISTYGELDIAGKVDGITMKGGVIRSEENAQISGLEISRGKVAVDGGMVQNVSAVRADITVNAGKLMETELLSGSLSVAGNGRVSHITLGTAAHFSLNSGAEGTDIVIGDGAACCISSGGMLSGAVLSGGGYLHAASGAVIRDLVWNPCDGVLEIASGAQVSFASALSGVYYGSGGYLLSSGPYFSDLAVDGEERVLYVCSDGNVKNTTVKDGGKMFVSSGGIAARTSVGAGGTLLVHSGGSAIGVDWTPCVGTVETQEGGLVVFNNALTGVFYGREDTLLLESDCVAGQDVEGERTSMYVMSDGLASSCRVTSGGKLFVRHGSAADIAAAEGGFIEIQSGGTAENVTVSSGGVVTAAGNITALSLQNGGQFNGFAFAEDLFFENTVNGSIVPFENVNVSGSRMTVDCGGRGQGVSVAEAEVSVQEGGCIEKFEFLSGSELFLAAGASAADTVISGADIVLANGGKMTGTRIESGSLSVVNGRAENVILSAEGRLFAGAGMTVTGIQLDEAARLDLVIDSKTVVNGRRGEQQFDIADGILADFTAGRGEISLREGEMRDVTLLSGASITLSGGRCSGTISLETGASLALSADTVLDFTLSGIGEKALINRLDLITGTPVYTITLSGDAAAGVYLLAEGAEGFDASLCLNGNELLTVNGNVLRKEDKNYYLSEYNGRLTLMVDGNDPGRVTVQGNTLSWQTVQGSEGYIAEFSQNGFTDVVRVAVKDGALDLSGLSAGQWQCRVKAAEAGLWQEACSIEIEAAETSPRVISTDADGNSNVLFVRTDGTWSKKYKAVHLGTAGVWDGTLEEVKLEGKNIISDVIYGSSDADILVLTDDICGDALFLEDIYTALPEMMKQQDCRLDGLDEIYAGAGDDVIDLTSSRFSGSGKGLCVYGGTGNDTIWAAAGNNRLFGDGGDDSLAGAANNDILAGGSGNDILHGGGGNDLFIFCQDWGNDTVYQLENSSVTLWFSSGDESMWDKEKRIFSDGFNTVAVSADESCSITLKFGNDGSEEYRTLSFSGAFSPEASEKITAHYLA